MRFGSGVWHGSVSLVDLMLWIITNMIMNARIEAAPTAGTAMRRTASPLITFFIFGSCPLWILVWELLWLGFRRSG